MSTTMITRSFEDVYNELKEAGISEVNLSILKKYDRMLSLSVQETSRRTKLQAIRKILLFAHTCENNLPEMTEDDVLDILQQIETYTYIRKDGKEVSYSDLYKNAVKTTFKQLLKYVDNENYEIIKSRSSKGAKLPEELLTKDEILKMVDGGQNPRDKALILSLYESGARISELLEMKIKNLSFDEHGAVLMLARGKTGMRRVRVVNASMLLQQWIDCHPDREDPDAPLWCTQYAKIDSKGNGYYPQVTYSTIRLGLRRIAEKKGIKKKVNPHSLRHARATHLAETLTEQQMKSYLGWTPGSNMAATYVHLSGKDVDNAILRMNGIDIDNDPIDTMKPSQCPRCQKMCPPNSSFCGNCGLPMSEDAKIAYKKKMENVMDSVLSVPKNEQLKHYITNMKEK